MLAAVLASSILAASLVNAGTVVWNGSFSPYTTSAAFDAWSFSSEVGTYQWYIHGSQPTSHYLNTAAAYKNPADTSETVGLKLTIDGTALWNGQTMERTELIPQTSTNIGTGLLFYHFSLMISATNPPDSTIEHQILFFESHFIQLKYGVAPIPNQLTFLAGSATYSIPIVAGQWMNFAYQIDFSGGTAGLWYSTGANPLVEVVQPVSVGASSNSADFHVGVLKLSESAVEEDYYISGVYVESGPINTNVAGPSPGSGGSAPPTSSSTTTTSTNTVGGGSTTSKPTTTSSSSSSKTTTTTVTTVTKTTTSSAAGPSQTHYGQCGGIGWTGPTVCAAGTTCKASGAYYSQCL